MNSILVNLSRRRVLRGFTLIELVVVIVVVAILASLAAFAYTSLVSNARTEAAVQMANQLKK